MVVYWLSRFKLRNDIHLHLARLTAIKEARIIEYKLADPPWLSATPTVTKRKQRSPVAKKTKARKISSKTSAWKGKVAAHDEEKMLRDVLALSKREYENGTSNVVQAKYEELVASGVHWSRAWEQAQQHVLNLDGPVRTRGRNQ